MTRLFMGWKSGVGSVLKVMTNDTDDPLTTPNTDYAKFRFNSETGKIGYIFDTKQFTWNATSYPSPGVGNANYHAIDGSYSTCIYSVKTSWVNETPQGTKYTMAYFINMSRMFSDGVPRISEIRYKDSSGYFFKNSDVYYENLNYSTGNWWGNFVYEQAVGFIRKSNETRLVSSQTLWNTNDYLLGVVFSNGAGFGIRPYGVVRSLLGDSPLGDLGVLENDKIPPDQTAVVSIWDLPANNNPLPTPGAYSAGKKMIVMSPSIVKIALGGHDVDTATYDQLILSSDKVPAKIIAAGDVTIAANSSTFININTAFPLTGTIYVDYIIKFTGGTQFIPFQREDTNSWSGSEIYINYKVDLSNNRIELINPKASSVTIRYMVIGDDDVAQTSGGGKVLETGSNFQRILRPGANSTSPSWSDILLDTRLPYLPILAEGYEPVSGFGTNSVSVAHRGNKSKTINFTNGGLKPFLKFSIVTTDGHCYPPHLRKIIYTGFNISVSRESGSALLTDTSVTFYANPTGYSRATYNASNNLSVTYDGPTIAGFRYYILGLPI